MTSQVKEAILETFTIVGGEKCLGKIAEDDQHIFCTLLCKVLQFHVGGNAQGPITSQIIACVPEPYEASS